MGYFSGKSMSKTRRKILIGLASSSAMLCLTPAYAKEALNIGVILPLSGTFADQGSHYETGIRMYLDMHGSLVAGRNIKMIIKDDQGPGSGDLARRLTQELIARDKAEIILGYSFTPNAMAAAGILTQAKRPAVIINAMTSVLTEKSPYFTRISATMPMVAYTQGKWAAEQGMKSAYVIVSDYAPGIEAETWFIRGFEDGGGKILGKDRTPVTAMEYGPFLQRAIESKPEAIFGFNPGGDVSIAFMKQAGLRLKGTGIQLLVTGDVVDDNLLPAMGNAVENVISAWHYQTDLNNTENIKFLNTFKAKFGKDKEPSYRVLQGYDAMDLVFKTLEKTSGQAGDAFIEGLRGMKLDSPRGPIEIESKTRDIKQNIYIRKGLKTENGYANKQIDVIKNVSDPAKK